MLNKAKIGKLLEQGPCKNFAAGEPIPCPGITDNKQKSMYILLSGTIDVFTKSAAGGVRKSSSIISGDVFGGYEYFVGATESLYRAAENVTVYLLTDESFNDLSWTQPEVLFSILHSAYMPPRKPTATATPTSTKAPLSAMQSGGKQQPSAPPVSKAGVKTDKAATEASVREAAQASVREATRRAVEEKAKAQGQETLSAEKLQSIKAFEAQPLSGLIYPKGHKKYIGCELTVSDKLVYKKDFTCPYCKKQFKDFTPFRSKIVEIEVPRYDFRKFYTDFYAEWFDVMICPHCYFSIFSNYFTEPKPMKKTEIETNIANARAGVLIDFDAERDINHAFTAHYLALQCCDAYTTTNKQIRARLWSNICWLYEDIGDTDMEKFAAGKVADSYEAVFSESQLTAAQEQIALLTTASMLHHAGLDADLKKYLVAAKTKPMGDKKHATLADEFMKELGISE